MNRALLPKVKIATSLSFPVCMLLFMASCNGSLFKVKSPSVFFKVASPSALSPMTNAASVDLGSISLRAAPLLTDEETQELFESNLQLAGLLPVRLEITHNSGTPTELRTLKFRLHDASNSEWKLVSAKQAIARILKFNGVSVYNPYSRKTFEKEFRAYEFDLKTPLTNEERRRQGLIIFQTAQKRAVSSPRDLVLLIEGLAQPVSLKLN